MSSPRYSDTSLAAATAVRLPGVWLRKNEGTQQRKSQGFSSMLCDLQEASFLFLRSETDVFLVLCPCLHVAHISVFRSPVSPYQGILEGDTLGNSMPVAWCFGFGFLLCYHLLFRVIGEMLMCSVGVLSHIQWVGQSRVCLHHLEGIQKPVCVCA